MPISTIKTLTTDASATSSSISTDWIPLNLHATPFNVGFGVYCSGTGQPTVRVEHTFHNVMKSTTGVDTFIHEDVSGVQLTSATNTLDGNYAFAVNAIRLTSTATSGAATVHFRVNQAGI